MPSTQASDVAPNVAATVDVLVPCYNEERTLPASIPALRDFLASDAFPYGWRITIGDNASSDRTPDVARELTERYPGEVFYVRSAEKGKGRMIKEGWLASESDILAFMDADLSTGLEHFPDLVRAVAIDGYDVAVGSRLMRGATVERSLKREVLSRGYNLIVKALFMARFSDAQCGFKAIRRDAAHQILPLVRDTGFFFDTELLVLAGRLGYRVTEIPIGWVEGEGSTVKVGDTILANLGALVRLRLRSVKKSHVREARRIRLARNSNEQ